MPHFQHKSMIISLRQDFFTIEKNADVFNEFVYTPQAREMLSWTTWICQPYTVTKK